MLTKWWAGYHIGQLELSQGANVAGNVISVSTDYGVLSSYTAFLCLEDSTYFCPQCQDESGTHTAVSETRKDSVEMTAAPNPFADHVIITVKNATGLKQSDVHVYGIDGRETAQELILEDNGEQLRIEWHPGVDVRPGVYLLSIRNAEVSKVIRLMKDR